MLLPVNTPVSPQVIQFLHPGGEHKPDNSGTYKAWNQSPHKRKFMRVDGEYWDARGVRRSELVFWGEWEPESAVLHALDSVTDGFPGYVFEPFYVRRKSYRGVQNTDPFVFGNRFLYTGCQQYRAGRPTQLRNLEAGSLILFGSPKDGCFLLDTVFVVSSYVDHTYQHYAAKTSGKVPPEYYHVTLKPWYSGGCGNGDSFRLYLGATPTDPMHGTFSFFPALTYAEPVRTFARPAIRALESRDGLSVVNGRQTQGFKALAVSAEGAAAIWQQIVDEVLSRGLLLGTRADVPPERSRSVAGTSPAPLAARRKGGCR